MIVLTQHQLTQIHQHAAAAYPDECCGALLGLFNGTTVENKSVMDVLPIDNKRDDGEAYHRFVITPEDFLSCEKTARALKCDVIGFYHSHPDHPAQPSQYDLDHALPVYSYLIVSVVQSQPADTTSWVMKQDVREFENEEVQIKREDTARHQVL